MDFNGKHHILKVEVNEMDNLLLRQYKYYTFLMIQKETTFRTLYALVVFTALMLFSISLKDAGANTNQTTSEDMARSRPEQSIENIQISYITLRNKTGSNVPSDFFGGLRGNLHAGACTISLSPIWGLEELANSAPFYIPDEKIEMRSILEGSTDELLSEIKSFSNKDDGNVVVYIHGYNIDFEKGCRHSAVLQRSLGLHDRLLLFSWPADGSMLKYTWDEADLVWSVPFMADFFEDFVKESGYGRTDIVAHSLGARGAVQALTRLAYREYDKPLFDELVLIAPDIDTDTFKHDLALLKRVVNRITIYVSKNDKALRLSSEVHGYPRLGEAGDALTILEGVETIDISLLSIQRLSGHIYHLSNKEVIEDLELLLHSKSPADKRPRLKKIEHEGMPYWQLLPDNK